uniref:Uncharacterized protein n=1 Tax=Lotharella oceanica TaxID=641309 RepID=A0A7S2TGD9_9EUKA|mmetsp:Transcript_13005/g.24895  ORF Transcript_13005/g.24895 Transcript_13005/m.24895 type:complete len:147 (+) Transcript_13005:24-464(+)
MTLPGLLMARVQQVNDNTRVKGWGFTLQPGDTFSKTWPSEKGIAHQLVIKILRRNKVWVRAVKRLEGMTRNKKGVIELTISGISKYHVPSPVQEFFQGRLRKILKLKRALEDTKETLLPLMLTMKKFAVQSHVVNQPSWLLVRTFS